MCAWKIIVPFYFCDFYMQIAIKIYPSSESQVVGFVILILEFSKLNATTNKSRLWKNVNNIFIISNMYRLQIEIETIYGIQQEIL